MLAIPFFSTYRTAKVILGAVIVGGLFFVTFGGSASRTLWGFEWPDTDFDKTSIDFSEIMSGGPPKDGIKPVDNPRFGSIAEVSGQVAATEPVVTVAINGKAKAYPLSILMWHEIVNDELNGVPIAVTFCPLCNSAIVFDRRVGDQVLDFGTTGKLRFSDLVMYDRQTESWWQQFIGEAIVGEMTGTQLSMMPVRVEAFSRFVERYPDGQVQLRPGGFRRNYGGNPYAGYDSSSRPFLYRGSFPQDIAPLAYVVAVGDQAWSLDLLESQKRIEVGNLVLTWEPGMNSALDQRTIVAGRDIGNVIVQRRVGDTLVDEVHDMTFAFSFHAFHPDGTIHQ